MKGTEASVVLDDGAPCARRGEFCMERSPPLTMTTALASPFARRSAAPRAAKVAGMCTRARMNFEAPECGPCLRDWRKPQFMLHARAFFESSSALSALRPIRPKTGSRLATCLILGQSLTLALVADRLRCCTGLDMWSGACARVFTKNRGDEWRSAIVDAHAIM